MKTKKQFTAAILTLALVFGMLPGNEVLAKKGASLSSRKITIIKGKSKTLKVKNTKSRVKWKITSGKKNITMKKKGLQAVILTGKKKGNAKVQAVVGKKKLICKVTVKNAPQKDIAKPTATPESNPSGNQASPSPTEGTIIVPNPSEGADEKDIAALNELIQAQRQSGATVSEDLNHSEYTWEDGRLKRIDWESKSLSGQLDLSKLEALEEIECSDNKLTEINVTENVNLKKLYCSNNQIKSIDVSKNTLMEWLFCDGNGLTSLDISNNLNLTNLLCDNNFLSVIDVSKNTALEVLSCNHNQLTELNVSANKNLEHLECLDNQIKVLDLTYNPEMAELYNDDDVVIIGFSDEDLDY